MSGTGAFPNSSRVARLAASLRTACNWNLTVHTGGLMMPDRVDALVARTAPGVPLAAVHHVDAWPRSGGGMAGVGVGSVAP
ncbi:hypothetical protein Sm713_25710 [Streptomyces sp. TS71-3]|nr:hypothetical protein Sm713_25710 [Streptomyces sp. TS71-3]